MNSITKSNLGIEVCALKQGHYFQSLLEEAVNKQIFPEDQMEKLQYSLLELMAKEVERYTNGESSSVPIESAQELLQSITYLVGAYLKTVPDIQTQLELLKKETMTVLFYRGLDVINQIYKEAHELLKHLQNRDRKLLSIAYQDTLFKGLPEFFHDYNMEFGAHELPGSIDYPLLNPLYDYLGVEMTAQYVQYLNLEDRIISGFPADRINLLIRSYDREAEHLLINICELVIINSIGCSLLQKEVRELNITRSEAAELHQRIIGLDNIAVEHLLTEALMKLGEELVLTEDEMKYLQIALPQLSQRLWNNSRLGNLEHFFVIFGQSEEITEEIIDGTSLEDDKLRDFILELNLLNSIKEKAALIRERIRSMEDLILILEECFNPEEYQSLFLQLGREELELLRKRIQSEAGGIPYGEYEPEIEWQKQLMLLSR